MAEEILQYAGQVIIDSITLYTSDRQKSIDLSLLFSEVNIFEDIYSSTMHGSVSILDGFNLPSVFPILGEELLEFKCHTPTSNVSITKQFAVIGLDDRTFTTNKSQVYSLKFVTYESLMDLNLRVQRSYTGTPSDSAVQIFSTYFPNKQLRVEDSSNTLKLVAPTISPFSMMNLLASKALTKGGLGEPTFLFFEDNQTYNFISLSSLIKQPSKMTYRWSQSQLRVKDAQGESTRDIQAEYENVKDITIDGAFNTIDKVMNGAMGHKVLEVDIIRKTINKRTYSYLDNFSVSSHLNEYPTNSDSMVHTTNAVIETSIIHPAHHDGFNQDRDAEILTKRIPELGQEEFIKLDVVVNGRTDIKAGDVITFEMGKFSTNDETDQYLQDMIDPFYSGNYLIAAIQHRFTLNRHESIMQLVKDSFPTKIIL